MLKQNILNKIYSLKTIFLLLAFPVAINWLFLLLFGGSKILFFTPKYILNPIISGFYNQLIWNIFVFTFFLWLFFKKKIKLNLISSFSLMFLIFFGILNLIGASFAAIPDKNKCPNAIYQPVTSTDLGYNIFVQTKNPAVYKKIVSWEEINGTILVIITKDEKFLEENKILEIVNCSIKANTKYDLKNPVNPEGRKIFEIKESNNF
jgi:hypothetical protein